MNSNTRAGDLVGSTYEPLALPATVPGLSPLRIAAYLLAVLAVWSLIGRYWGIQHDALGYMLQAAAKLQPDPLAGDIFLRYRSQEEFTLFPQICAYFVAWLGVDRAGSLLTLSFLLMWFALAWLLARRLLGPRLALLSVGLLIAIPGWYSAGEVFRYAEPFLTARALAEVLSLGAMVAVLHSRRIAAGVLAALALAIHPLMAFPAALLVAAHASPLGNWRQWAAVVTLVVLGATVGSYLLLLPDPWMDGQWLEVTRWRSGFLFVGEWAARDLEVAVQALLTLALAVAVLPTSEARRIATAALCIGISGLALAYVASEFLPLKLLLQGQPWRWLWIGRFAATALLPLVGFYLWRAGKLGQSVATLLGSAWLLTDAGSTRDVEPFGVGGLLCLLALAMWLVRRRISPRVGPTLWVLSWCVLAIVLLGFVSVIMVAVSNHFTFGDEPVWVQRVTDVLYTPGIAALFVSGAWATALLVKNRAPAVVAAIVSCILLAGALPETLRRWTDTPFGDSHRADFAAWRATIPTDAEVLWNEAPQAVWFLLDRRSYLTVSQAAGTVFSRETTVEITRRANALSPLVAPGAWVLDPATREEKMHDLTAPILRGICREPTLGFVVSKFDVGGAALRAEWPGKADYVYLYDCRDFRQVDS